MVLTAEDRTITIRNLSVTFPGQRALSDVNMTLLAGSVHALVGENGSGKSTLIKVLAGYHVPEPGSEIRVGPDAMRFGAPPSSHTLGLRFVHQNLGLIRSCNAIENVALTNGYLTSRSGRIDWRKQAAITRAALLRIGMDFDVTRPVGELPAIEQAGLAIARAILGTPDQIRLLVLDEPTAALPPSDVTQLFTVIREIESQGIAVLYVSHRLAEVLELAAEISVLRDGNLQGTLPASEVGRDQLIDLIVGPNVHGERPADPSVTNDALPTAQEPRRRPRGEVVLSVREMSAEGLEPLSFDAHRGEVVGVAGLLGSGRELVPYALFGAISSRIKELTVCGVPMGRRSPRAAIRAGMALVPGNRQKGSAVAEFSLRENLTLPNLAEYCRRGRVDRRREASTVRTWLTRFDVRPPDPGRMYRYFSGGNQQKVLLAKWMAMAPRVMLLDEPTSGVDVGARSAIHEMIRAAAGGGMCFVLSSADFDDFVQTCSRVLLFADGRLAGELTGDEISEDGILRALAGIASCREPNKGDSYVAR